MAHSLTRTVRVFTRSPLARTMAGIGSAAALSQVASLLVAPVLSRLFPETAFGQFGAFFAFANVAATVALLGLNDAVLAARSEESAQALFAGGILASIILAPPLMALTFLLIRTDLLGLGALPPWTAILIGLELMVLALLLHFQAMLVRARRYRAISTSYLALGPGRAFGQVGGGLLLPGFGGLAGGELLGRCAALLTMTWALRAELTEARRVGISAIWRALYEYRAFPVFRTPSTLVSAAAVSAPPLMVLSLYDAAAAGYYTLMLTALAAPLALTQRAVGDVFIGHFGERFRNDPALGRQLLRRIVVMLTPLALVSGLVLYFAAPALFTFIFGANWLPAGQMAAMAAPMFASQLVVMPISNVISIANRPELKILYDLMFVGGLLMAYAIAAILRIDPVAFVGVLALVVSLATLAFLGLILHACSHPRIQS